jgi:trafficking protein particle complex subunit 1
VYGMLFSLKSFVNKLSPTDMKQGFLSYKVPVQLDKYGECCTGTVYMKSFLNTLSPTGLKQGFLSYKVQYEKYRK